MTKKDTSNTRKKPLVYKGMDSDTFQPQKDADELEKMIQQRKRKLVGDKN